MGEPYYWETCVLKNLCTWGQLGLLAIWATWTLGNFSFGWLELWVTWALRIWETWSLDSLGNLDIGQVGCLQLWETCVLYLLGNLCIVKLDSRFGGWKYFQSCWFMYFVMDYLRTFTSQEYRKNIISQKKSFLTDVQKIFQNKIPKIRSWSDDVDWHSFLKYYPFSTYEFPVKEIRTY